MGNSCQCLGGGDGNYGMVGRKPATEGESASGGEGNPTDSEVTAKGRSGSYRRTEAKYHVPETNGNSAVNSGSPRKQPAQSPKRDTNANQTKGDSHGDDPDSADPGNHVPSETPASSDGAPPARRALKTHVEVFLVGQKKAKNLRAERDVRDGEDRVPASDAVVAPDVIQISLDDEKQDGDLEPTTGGRSNPGFEGDADETPVLSMPDTIRGEDGIADGSGGIANPAFETHEEPRDVTGDVTENGANAGNDVMAHGVPVLREERDNDEADLPPPPLESAEEEMLQASPRDVSRRDSFTYFFGLSSLKLGTQADRAVDEMIAEIETIEEKLCSTLVADDKPESQGHPTSNLYEDVLDKLRDVCRKVENVLRGNQLANEEESESWLALPELKDLLNTYSKKSHDLQEDTTKSLLEAAERKDEAQLKDILEDYNKRQEELVRMRDNEREGFLKKLKANLASREDGTARLRLPSAAEDETPEKEQRDSGGADEYTAADEAKDAEDVRQKYAEILQDDAADVDGSSEQSSSADDTSSASEEESEEEETEAKATLKLTLTADIKDKIQDMTSENFRSLMATYRQDRAKLKGVREAEQDHLKKAMWKKLAGKTRQLSFDQPSKLNGVAEEPSENEAGSNAGTQSDALDVELRDAFVQVDADMCLGTDQVNDELSGIDLSDKQSVKTMLSQHFKANQELRDHQRQSAKEHRTKLLTKLRARLQQRDETTARDIEDMYDEYQKTEEDITEQEDDLPKSYLLKFGERAEVSREDLRDLLESYKSDQEKMIQRRKAEASRLRERLQEKLAALKDIHDKEEEDSAESQEENNEAEKETSQLDNAFFEDLSKRRAAGALSEADLVSLIDQHLDSVEQHRRDIRRLVSKRRKERRHEEAKESAAALLEDDRESRQQLRRLRQDERDKAEVRLQEKLKRRKHKKSHDESPELPPPKLPSKKKRGAKSNGSSVTQLPISYENVEVAER